jgi:hypothetical protein
VRAMVKTVSILMDSHQKHPEVKSLGPDGKLYQRDNA